MPDTHVVPPLVAAGEIRLAPFEPKPGPAFFLAGDSYPAKSHIENALRARLAPAFSGWIGQADLLDRTGETCFRIDIARRLVLLDQAAPASEGSPPVVLIGRSSGARVISLLASRRGVAAVICLGYPFRQPGRALEPERFAHLARMTVPTLIVQGVGDPYGGIDLTEHYVLSPSVRLMFVAGDHEFNLPPGAFDAIGRSIAAFCGRAPNQRPDGHPAFDEAFYLRAHPDVRHAVVDGVFASGEQHYRNHGHAEKRRFRLLPPPAAAK